MPDASLLTHAALAVGTAIMYWFVGRMMLERPREGEARRALAMFATWWFALGAMTLISAVRAALAAFGVMELDVHFFLSLVAILPLTVALWGLNYYLLYLYTGRAELLKPLTGAYAAFYVFFVFVAVWLHPVDVVARGGELSFVNERVPGMPLLMAIFVVLLGPVIASAVAYGSLFFRLRDRTLRFRVAVVSTTFVIWFASPLISLVPALHADAWPVPLSRVLGLLAPAAIILAHAPPAWLRRRFGIRGLDTQSGERPADDVSSAPAR